MAKKSFGVDMRIKKMFFDRAKVIQAVDAPKRRILSRHAGAIRKIARRSMKRVSAAAKRRRGKHYREYLQGKRKTVKDQTISRPGKPPKIHTSGDNNPKKILYGFDSQRGAVIVGPVKFNKPGNALEALEHGGRTTYFARSTAGPVRSTAVIQARPFMRPALAKELPNMQRQWKDVIRAR